MNPADEITLTVIDAQDRVQLLTRDQVHQVFIDNKTNIGARVKVAELDSKITITKAEWVLMERAYYQLINTQAHYGTSADHAATIKRLVVNEVDARGEYHILNDHPESDYNKLLIPIIAGGDSTESGGSKTRLPSHFLVTLDSASVSTDSESGTNANAAISDINSLSQQLSISVLATTTAGNSDITLLDCHILPCSISRQYNMEHLLLGIQSAKHMPLEYWPHIFDRANATVYSADSQLAYNRGMDYWRGEPLYEHALAAIYKGHTTIGRLLSTAISAASKVVTADGPSSPLKLTDNVFLRDIEKYTNTKFATQEWARWMQLLRVRGIYNYMAPKSDSAAVLERLALRQEYARTRAEVRTANVDRHIHLQMIKQIIKTRLNRPDVLQQVITQPHLFNRADDIVRLLKPAEQKLVELELKRGQQYLADAAANTCPHKRTVKLFKMGKVRFLELKPYLSSANTGANADSDSNTKTNIGGKTKTQLAEILRCKLCNFNLICPHYLATHNIREYIIGPGVSACVICGEELAESLPVETEVTEDIDERLYELIRNEVSSLMRFITTAEPSKLIKNTINHIYIPIEMLHKQISKARTENETSLKDKTRVYIVIYTLAYFVYLVNSSASYRLNMVINGTKKNAIVNMLDAVYKTIMTYKNATTSNLTSDAIKTALIVAFKHVSSGVAPADVVHEVEFSGMAARSDPIFSLLLEILRRAKAKSGSIIEALTTDTSGGDKTKNKNKAKSGNAKFNKTIIRGQYDNIQIPKIITNAHSSPGAVAWAAAAELFMTYVQQGLYLQDCFEIGAPLPRVPGQPATDNMVLNPRLQTFNDELCRATAAENAIQLSNSCPPIQSSPVVTDPWYYQRLRTTTAFARSFDAKGKKHKWTLVPKFTNTATAVADATGAIGSRDIIHHYKCSVCGATRDDSCEVVAPANIKNEVIAETLKNMYIIDNFYRYYDVRCPTGNVHAYLNDDITVASECTKCHAIRGRRDEKYYSKWLSQYLLDIADTSGDLVFPAAEYKPPPTHEWTFDFNFILETAQLLEVDYHLIACLGSVENQRYDAVISGEYTAADASLRDDTRIYRLESYIKMIIVDYNRCRYYGRLLRPPRELRFVADTVPLREQDNIHEHLDDIAANFQGDYFKIRINARPREIVNFLLQQICALYRRILAPASDMSAGNSKIFQTLRTKFVQFSVAKILRIDALTAHPREFNWAALYPKGSAASDVNFDDEKAEAPEDSDDEDARPMANTLDVEEDSDQDDGHNQINVEM